MIGASLSEPHTSVTALRTRVSIGRLTMDRPLTEKVLVKCRQNVANKLVITRVFNPVHPLLQQTDSVKCSTDYSDY